MQIDRAIDFMNGNVLNLTLAFARQEIDLDELHALIRACTAMHLTQSPTLAVRTAAETTVAEELVLAGVDHHTAAMWAASLASIRHEVH